MAFSKRSVTGMEYLNRLQRARPARRPPFAIEALEDRVLPSGITALPTKKVSFVDADGDKVTIKAKGDMFQISLLGNADGNADVDTLTIVPGKTGVFDPTATLTVQVKPGKTSGGIVEIVNLTMLDQQGVVERMASIELNNALVDNLALPGSLTTLTANKTDFGNVIITGALGSMVIGNHDLTGVISAATIGTITNVGTLVGGNIAGNIISLGGITKIVTNSITGSITAGGPISSLATAFDLDGTVEATGGTLNGVIGRNLDGTLIVHGGNLNLGTTTLARVDGDVTGSVIVDGALVSGLAPTLTIHANGDFLPGASISSSGSLLAKANTIGCDLLAIGGDATFAMATGGFSGSVTAGGNVFGDGTNGAIVIRGGDFTGQINAGGNIAPLTLNPNTLGFRGSMTAGGDIGAITTQFFDGASLIAGFGTNVGSIGNLTVTNTTTASGVASAILDSNFTAATNIGDISVKQTGGEHAIDQSAFEAKTGAMGSITAETTGTGSAIHGIAPFPTFSAKTTMGTISARAESAAAISLAAFHTEGNIGNITAVSSSGDGFDLSSFVSTAGSIGSITGTSISGVGIDGTTFQAATNIGIIFGTSTSGQAIHGSTFRADDGTISDITGRVTGTGAYSDAIADSNFTAGSTIGAILGDAKLGTGLANVKVSADGSISSITGKTLNEDANANKDGIQDSVFRTHGTILSITASTAVADSGLAGATQSEAIDGSFFSAFASILSATGSSITATGDIQESFFFAGYDIGGNLTFDGLAGPGSDDIRGDQGTPVQIGNISVASDIVASFFAAGVGSDNAIIGDSIVNARDDFNNAPGSSIGSVTVAGVIAGGTNNHGSAAIGGYVQADLVSGLGALAAFNADQIGVVQADAIGISDVDNTSVASIGFNTSFAYFALGSIGGFDVATGTRDQAIADGVWASTSNDIGFVTATNESSTARSAIGAAQFLAATFIGDITADTPNAPAARAIDGRASILGARFGAAENDSETDIALGNIIARGSGDAGSIAIEDGQFFTGPFLGQHIGTVTTVGNIVTSSFDSAGDLANVEGATGINVQGNIVDSDFSAPGSIAGDGGITVLPLNDAEGFISGSTFFASDNGGAASLGIGNILVEGINADGAAISTSSFGTTALASVHIGSILLSTGSLEESNITAGGDVAMSGGIQIHGNTVHKDFGIFDSQVRAGVSEGGGELGAITVGPSGLAKNVIGTEISGSQFSGWNIAVGMDGDVERAITVHGNNTGAAGNRSAAEEGFSIFESTFVAADALGTAGVGSIGDIRIGQSAGDRAGGTIQSSDFLANLHLGDVRVTIRVTDADEDVSAIRNSNFRGESIEDEVEFGSIGNIVAVILGQPSTEDVVVDSTFNAGPDTQADSLVSIGDVTITTEGSGVAVRDSQFRAGGSLGALHLQAGSVSNDAVVDSLFSAFGDIGSAIGNDIGVVGNVTGSKFLAGYDVGVDNQFNGFPLRSDADGATPGTERVNVDAVKINRISINGDLISTDIIVGVSPGTNPDTGAGTDNVFGNSAPAAVDAEGNPLPPLPTDDVVISADSKIGTIQVQGGDFAQGNIPKNHAIAAGFIGQFQQPNDVTHKADLPGFLDNGPTALDVRIEGAPSGAPVFISSRDFAGRQADFNGDGNMDAIILDSRVNQLKIFLGDGLGGFLEPTVFEVGNAPVSAVIGNFNGDVLLDADGDPVLGSGGNPVGALDIVVLNSLTGHGPGFQTVNTIDIFLSDPNGGVFTEAGHTIKSLNFGNRTLTSIASSDFVDVTNHNSPNGDGFLDLVITDATNNTVVMLNNTDTNNDSVADGEFVLSTVNNFGVGDSPSSIAVTPPASLISPEVTSPSAPDVNLNAGMDLDGPPPPLNGPDAVVANAGDNSISILFGGLTGTGQFAPAQDVAVGTQPKQVVLADVDDDNDIDILTVNFGSNDVTVLLNDGTGMYTSSVTVTVGGGPLGIVACKFDGDDYVDFATVDTDGSTVSVVLNTDGIFTGATATAITLTGLPLAITSADYNGDDAIDIAITNADNAQAPVVLANDGAGTFTIVT